MPGEMLRADLSHTYPRLINIVIHTSAADISVRQTNLFGPRRRTQDAPEEDVSAGKLPRAVFSQRPGRSKGCPGGQRETWPAKCPPNLLIFVFRRGELLSGRRTHGGE